MKTKEVKASSAWWCETCKSSEMTHPEMLAHLKDSHALETKGLKCSKKMLMHLDCADSFSSSYEVTIKSDKGEIKMTNSTTTPRSQGSLMNWA